MDFKKIKKDEIEIRFSIHRDKVIGHLCYNVTHWFFHPSKSGVALLPRQLKEILTKMEELSKSSS